MNLDLNTLMQVLQEVDIRQGGGVLPEGVDLRYAHNLLPTGRFGGYRQRDLTYSKWRESHKHVALTDTSPYMYDCEGIFGICGPDEIIGLSLCDDKLIQWMGWEPDVLCERFIKMIVYMDMAGTASGSPDHVHMPDPCAEPNAAEKGVCEVAIAPKGLLSVCGEAKDVTHLGERKCDKQPVYTLPLPDAPGGVRIDNDLDLEAITAAQALQHGLSRLVITGSALVAGQFDGLEQLVNTGYININTQQPCTAVDSIIVDWASDDMDGAVNGHGSIIAKVIDIVRRIKQRVSMSNLGGIRPGEIVLVMPTFMADCFLDAWVKYAIFPGVANNIVEWDALEARRFREEYTKGLYGDGYITVDGFPVPIIRHDWMTINQAAPNFCSDIYILSRRIGAHRALYGQYHPMDIPANVVREVAGYAWYRAMQGGRLLQWVRTDSLCISPCLAIKPRVYLDCPWAQARITDVCCPQQFSPISCDPQSSYFVETNLQKAATWTQYWYGDKGWFHPPFP